MVKHLETGEFQAVSEVGDGEVHATGEVGGGGAENRVGKRQVDEDGVGAKSRKAWRRAGADRR